jgi:GR25 family glycosyltransferase involved in LPS biosynthesis
MKSYAIVIDNHTVSNRGYQELIKSSSKVDNRFFIEKFNAVTSDTVDDLMKKLTIEWTWPHTGSKKDQKTGIMKVGYGGRDPKRRKACGMSHYMLWKECAETNEPLLIFEHDAVFNCKLNYQYLLDSHYQVIGLNDPHGATRLPHKYHGIVQKSTEQILPVPKIDKDHIAQGIAGNSAYMIKPAGAQKLLDLVQEHGMWNNDAIMCRQLMPDMIGVTKTYYTKTQKLPSTTMG